MPDTWVTPRIWVTSERVGQSKMNEISNDLRVLYPYTTTGDLAIRSASGNYLERKPVSQIAGLLHTSNSAFTNSNLSISSTGYTAIGSGFKFNLTLTVTSTVIAFAHGVGYKDTGAYDGYFALSIDGTIDPNDNARLRSTVNTPFSTMYKAAAVAAGTRVVELKAKTANSGDAVNLRSCVMYALAFVE